MSAESLLADVAIDYTADDLMWQFLDRDGFQTKLISSLAGINIVVFRNKLMPPHNPGAEKINLDFACFIKEIFRMTPFCPVDNTIRYITYMSAYNTEKYFKTCVNIIHNFLAVYTNYKRPWNLFG